MRGFIAQEVEKAFPEWVGEDSKGFKVLSLQPMQIAALEVEALRTLKAKNDTLESENKSVEARVSTLEDRLGALENDRNLPHAGFTYGNAGWGVAGLLLALGFTWGSCGVPARHPEPL